MQCELSSYDWMPSWRDMLQPDNMLYLAESSRVDAPTHHHATGDVISHKVADNSISNTTSRRNGLTYYSSQIKPNDASNQKKYTCLCDPQSFNH
mmetsp:Transcript_18838/g.34090  ORF Transcript_18838/g.34090 Transcript_18838/m.34090 type:complete len:94 (+) Transcript_18838:97-378(+)